MKNSLFPLLFLLIFTVGTTAVAKDYDIKQVEMLEQKLRNCREQLSPLKTELEVVKSELHRCQRQNLTDDNANYDNINEKIRFIKEFEVVKEENDKLKEILGQLDIELSQTDIQLMNSGQLTKEYSYSLNKLTDYENKLTKNKSFFWIFKKKTEVEWDPDFIDKRINETKKQIMLLKYAAFLKENNYITYKDAL
jgi:chromosome segregation ATPase